MIKNLTSEERNINPYLHIDPGFINYRKCYSTFGSQFITLYNQFSNKGTDHLAKMENDHLFVDLALNFCKENDIKSLGEVLNDPRENMVFCSVERLEGNEEVYKQKRVINRILLPYEYEKQVFSEWAELPTIIWKEQHRREFAFALMHYILECKSKNIKLPLEIDNVIKLLKPQQLPPLRKPLSSKVKKIFRGLFIA